jgi:hypothetical protein
MILVLTPPSDSIIPQGWLRLLFPFWSFNIIESDWKGWLLGWQVTPAIVFWHHGTMLMRPGKMNWWRGTRVILGYLVAIFAISVQIFTPNMFANVTGDPLYLNSLMPGPFYFPFIGLLALFTMFSLINLYRSAHSADASLDRRLLTILGTATLIAGLTTPFAFIAVILFIQIPGTILTILLTISLTLIGFGVARYSALIEGRTIRRDFIYNALAMGFVIFIYSIVAWISTIIFNVPPAAFVFLLILVIITHNLIDASRRTLDFIFFKRENQLLRENYRKLANNIGESNFSNNILTSLSTICRSIQANYGIILQFMGEEIQILATYKFPEIPILISCQEFYCDDAVSIEPGQFPVPLNEAAFMVPLYLETDQFGVIILGRPVNSTRYSEEDIERILYPIDQLNDVLIFSQRENAYLDQLSKLSTTQKNNKTLSINEVETAFRNIYDYSFLGDSELSHLRIVRKRMRSGENTHIDRGKALYAILTEALEKMRPDKHLPSKTIPRAWYPYLILYWAYIEDTPNRDIMSDLFISEGTFNRTRRSAIRTVTRVIEEMEP